MVATPLRSFQLGADETLSVHDERLWHPTVGDEGCGYDSARGSCVAQDEVARASHLAEEVARIVGRVKNIVHWH